MGRGSSDFDCNIGYLILLPEYLKPVATDRDVVLEMFVMVLCDKCHEKGVDNAEKGIFIVAWVEPFTGICEYAGHIIYDGKPGIGRRFGTA